MKRTTGWWASRPLLWLLLGCAVAGRAGSAGAAETVLTFVAVADATIKPGAPTQRFGASTLLEADNSPVEQFLVKFSVSGVGGGTVTSAKLRLYNVNTSALGGDIRRAESDWSDETVTWNTAPAVSPAILASLGAVRSGRWFEVDLTGHVTGDGLWSFHVSSRSTDGADYRSREAGLSVAPTLVLTVSGGGSPPPPPGPLTANAGPDQTRNPGVPVQFTGSASGGTGAYTFSWAFGDGASATGSSVTHVYTDIGTFEATLTVTDGGPREPAVDTVRVSVLAVARTLTFTPVADATIKPGSPNTNYGSSTILEVDNSPIEQFLMKFSVSGLDGQPVTSAKLRLYNVNGSDRGGDLWRVLDTTWLETAVTWNTAPTGDKMLAMLGPVSSGRWYEVDLTGHVTGEGLWSFRVRSTSSDGGDYRSKEGGAATSPQLVVVTGAGAGPPAPLTASAGPDQSSTEGAIFQFTASATGGTSPYTFTWDFGDGTSGSGASVTHVYRDNGAFSVTLTVTDAAKPSQTASDIATVTVVNVAPTANAGGPYTGVVGAVITFSGFATDPSADDTAAGFMFTWNFGDGDGVAGPGVTSPTHAYGSAGTYAVSLTVTDKDGASRSITTTADIGETMPPPPSEGFVVTAAGDYSANSNTAAVLQQIVPSGSNVHLALGDLSYGNLSPESAWCDYVKSRVGATFPFQLIAGNHDDGGSGDAHISNFAACLPDRLGAQGTYGKEYYFDYQGLARIILIAAGLTIDGVTYDYRTGNARYNWLADTIDGARQAGIPWVIVGMHYNCLSAGQYGCQTGTDLMNLLIAKRVDLVLHAHDHTYQRTKQLAHGTGCSAVPASSVNANCIVDDGGADGTYTKGAGTVIVVVGTGGTDLYNVSTGDSEAGYFVRLMGGNSNPSRGFLKATVTATTMTADFVPAVGTFTDHFTIGPAVP